MFKFPNATAVDGLNFIKNTEWSDGIKIQCKPIIEVFLYHVIIMIF